MSTLFVNLINFIDRQEIAIIEPEALVIVAIQEGLGHRQNYIAWYVATLVHSTDCKVQLLWLLVHPNELFLDLLEFLFDLLHEHSSLNQNHSLRHKDLVLLDLRSDGLVLADGKARPEAVENGDEICESLARPIARPNDHAVLFAVGVYINLLDYWW